MEGKSFTPFPVLTTARLTLRQLRSNDDYEIFALRSNDNINKYLDRQPSKSIEDARKFIQAITANTQSNTSVYWGIALSDTDKLVGAVCLFNFSENHSKAEIGYELAPDFQGKGLMQEALAAVIQFGFYQIGLHAIEAHTHLENQPSTGILKKLNFKTDGTVDNNLVLFTLTHDT
ncbi:GNAT family N-acetyltransferase [Hymenobacter edaphi]|uniref:N-acetyltransferase n=1 Tax=Hymenobacter edaphi TaxID=2211146 RepID=A0A328BGZ4_9BACT|nr:GNAT family N-acetyltransferase [Hymenobacter edaphi]RAK65154.1 N-acetyltransferase [Hymenobacter edaphi]